MKKQITKGMAVITAVMFFSIVSAPLVFAGDVAHTITIKNDSDTPLKSAGKNFQKGNYGALATCGTDACPAENNLTVNDATIPAKGSGTVTMTGPAGCRIMAFMSYWIPDATKSGQIQCTKTWGNICNASVGNLTCTISQDNVDKVKGKGTNTATTASSVQ